MYRITSDKGHDVPAKDRLFALITADLLHKEITGAGLPGWAYTERLDGLSLCDGKIMVREVRA